MTRIFVLTITAIIFSWAFASWGYTLHEVGLNTAFLEFDYFQSMPLYTLKHWTAFKEVFPIAVALFLALEAYVIIGELSSFKRKPKLGTSRFARYLDIKKSKLFGNKGLWLGYSHNKPLRLPGFESALVVAPTGGGKTTNLAIPNVLTFDGSIIVNDLKGEIYKTCSRALKNKGYECFQYAPFDPKSLHGYNPLAIVRRDPHYIFQDLKVIADCLMPDNSDGKHSFFTSNAQMIFIALAIYILEKEPTEKQTLDTIYRLVHQSDLTKALERVTLKNEAANDDLQCLIVDLKEGRDDTQKDILSGIRTDMKSLASPNIRKLTGNVDFNFTNLRENKTFISIKIKPLASELDMRVVNLFWNQLLHIQTEVDEPKGLPLFFLLEEFGNLGKVKMLAAGMSYLRSYRIRAMMIIQDTQQLYTIYGKAAQSFINAKAKIIYTLTDDQDSKRFSSMLGKETIKVRTIQNQSGRRGSNSNNNESWLARDLMTHDEIMRMDDDTALLILQGRYPVKMTKKPWYEIQHFCKMLS